MGLSVFGLLLCVFCLAVFGVGLPWALLFALLVGVGLYDLGQKHRSILRNYPIIGHLRFMLEFIRPEIRQYFLETDNEATPVLALAALAGRTSAPRATRTSALRHATGRARRGL